MATRANDRNIIRHAYHGLSDTILRGVIVDEIPALERAVAGLPAQHPPA
ncbi:hypothetical protein C8J36_103119 [Rhizobium sp. PP-F2F-G48]|nr:hypothetical protein C8J36_103119 [Rhizobium sp. PP-F2F-G48]